MKDRSSDWDQRLIRLETSLKKSRLETEQRHQQVRQLEEQVDELMAALKEKTAKVDSRLSFHYFSSKIYKALFLLPKQLQELELEPSE